VRLLKPRRDRTFAPYIALGLGVVHYNPAGDVGDIVFPTANAIFPGETETEFAGVFGLGTDVLPNWRLGGARLGLRFELMDHYAFNSPLEPIVGDDFDGVHHLRLTGGLHVLGGRLFPEPVAILPPAPPPAPPPPPPPPAEEALTICVVDLDAPGGIREVSA